MRAGLPVSVPGMTVRRACSSGLGMATPAKQIADHGKALDVSSTITGRGIRLDGGATDCH